MATVFLTHFKIICVIRNYRLHGTTGIIYTLFDCICVLFYLQKMSFNIVLTHYQTIITNFIQIFVRKIFFPVKRNIAPLLSKNYFQNLFSLIYNIIRVESFQFGTRAESPGYTAGSHFRMNGSLHIHTGISYVENSFFGNLCYL